jgi:hypothetical protein
MKIITIIAAALTVLNIAGAQSPSAAQSLPKMTVIGSVSGQFFVSAKSATLSPQSLDLAAGAGLLTLDPALTAISCERIKVELLHELNLPDKWQGKIFVMVHPARSAADPVDVYPERMGGHWNCGMELPDAVDRNRFVEAVVRASLMEIANRNASDHSAEIPEWLARGLTRQLMGSSEIKLILPPPRTLENGLTVTRSLMDFSDTPNKSASLTRLKNPLTEAAEILKANSPLSFDELSWPTDEQLSREGVDVYGSSAQLFVNRLMHLKKGPECLGTMLGEMPDYLNWQLAFLDAFKGRFQKPLDVEKWWALELTQFAGRDLLHLLTKEESARQLDEVFQFPIEVRIGAAPPMRTDITFQTIIRGWSRTRQLQTVKAKIWELDLLRMRLAPDFIPLVDEYRQALQEYYKKRNASTHILAGFGLLSDKSGPEAIVRLDALDVRRANLRHQIETPIASAIGTLAP